MNSKERIRIIAEPYNHSHMHQRTAADSRHLQMESLKDIINDRVDPSYDVIGQCARRLNGSAFYATEHKRTNNPLLRSSELEASSYFQGLQKAILQENRNIRQHNAFLKGQIKLMFEREKKHKSSLATSRQKIRQLQGTNRYLQSQLKTLYTSIISEIERIQKIIEEEKGNRYDQLLMISQSFNELPQKSMDLGSETESTINHNLEELKQKMANMAIYRTSFDSFTNEDCFKFQSPSQRCSNQLSQQKIESIITKENSIKDATSSQIEKDDLFQAYLPSNIIGEHGEGGRQGASRKS